MGSSRQFWGDYLIVGGKELQIIEKGGVAIEGERIVQVKPKLGNYLGKGSVIMPGLVNSHLHLEFSAHRCRLTYGRGFVEWLKSVIRERETLFSDCTISCFKRELENLLKSGVTAIGEISSTGRDIVYLKKSPLKGVIYSEIVGLNPGIVDFIYGDFKSRVEEVAELEQQSGGRWRCGISIHSPYSVHPKLIEKGLELAEEFSAPLQVHLLESRAEREWLEIGKGPFKTFFRQQFPYARPHFIPEQFISLFKGFRVGFVHGVYCGLKEWEQIGQIGGGVIHSPISNRLLEGGVMDYPKLIEMGISAGLGTDGLSSNYTLNIWEEMRIGLMVHLKINPEQLAKLLLKSVIWENRQILGIEGGEIKPGAIGDIAIFYLPEPVGEISQLYLQLILHTREVSQLYISGHPVVPFKGDLF